MCPVGHMLGDIAARLCLSPKPKPVALRTVIACRSAMAVREMCYFSWNRASHPGSSLSELYG